MSNNPLDRATSTAPPTLGEGCTSRYDPQALTPAHGTEFPGAEALWQAVAGNEHPEPDTVTPDEAP